MTITITGKKVDARAYKDRTDITEVVLGSAIKLIGDEAFSGCYNLKKINFPSGLEFIGDRAFYKCNGLVISHSTNSDYTTELYHVGVGAFESSTISSESGQIKFGGKTEYISDKAFYNCDGVNLYIPANVNKIRSIGNYAFANCTGSFSQFIMPPYVESVGDYAYYRCSDVTSVSTSNHIQIGECAFNGCASLQHIELPNVVSIGRDAFSRCTELSKVCLGIKLHKIEAGTFSSCFSLSYIYIPYSVLDIGGGAFYGCGKNVGFFIANLGTHSMPPRIRANTFDDTGACDIIIPDEPYTQWESVLDSYFYSDPNYGMPYNTDIYYVSLSENDMIRFNIGVHTFLADKDMTWEAWGNSDYAKTYALPSTTDMVKYALSTRICVDKRNYSSQEFSRAINWPCADRVLSVANIGKNGNLTRVTLGETIQANATYSVAEGMYRSPHTYDKYNGWMYNDYVVY